MPMITCPDCNREMSDTAPACPGCGRPNSVAIATPARRPVGLALGFGIFLVPVIFAWFTLRKGYSSTAKVISFAWLAFSLIIFASQDGAKKTPASNASSQGSYEAAPVDAAIQVEIHQIISDYEGNEVAADNRYKGNQVQVTGIVWDIKKDIMDNLYVMLGSEIKSDLQIQIRAPGSREMQAYFDDSMSSQLGSLQKGQRLTVVCTVKGLMMNVIGEDCIIK